jgi:hypothetical protein
VLTISKVGGGLNPSRGSGGFLRAFIYSITALSGADENLNFDPINTNIVYTDIVKNITISVDEELWANVREAAANERVSMNSFIRSVLARTVKRSGDSTGARLATLAESIGPATKTWTWNRDEIYKDAG